MHGYVNIRHLPAAPSDIQGIFEDKAKNLLGL